MERHLPTAAIPNAEQSAPPVMHEAERAETASIPTSEVTRAATPPVAIPVPEAVAPAPARTPTPVLVPSIPLALPPDSDLVLVETSRHAPTPIIDAIEPPRPKRVRPPKVEVASETLEIVETRKEPPAAA